MKKEHRGSDNYRAGAQKGFGDTIQVNEYSGLTPGDLPKQGDYVILKTRAHELIEVTPFVGRTDAVRYRAIIRRLSEVPETAKRWDSTPLIRDY